jgi:hypothetical protein
LLGSLLYLENTVETGISYHIYSRDADTFEQSLTLFVLYEETGKALQHSSIVSAVPFEEHLILAEDTAHAISRNVAMLQDMKEIRPELILDEESHHRTYQSKETDGVQPSIHRHIFDHKPTLSEVKELVVSAINTATEEKIINGFVWNGKAVYLSPENQLNFSAIERSEKIPYPLILKINEQEDGTPIYHTFENADDFIAFSQAACAYVIKTVQEGWKEKDEVDWTVFNLKSNNDEKVD